MKPEFALEGVGAELGLVEAVPVAEKEECAVVGEVPLDEEGE